MTIKHVYDLLRILLKQNAKGQIKKQNSKLLIYDEYLNKYVSADELLTPCHTKDIIKGKLLQKKSREFLLYDLLLKKFINPKLDLLCPAAVNRSLLSRIWDYNINYGNLHTSSADHFWENKQGRTSDPNEIHNEFGVSKVGWAGQITRKPESNPRPEQSALGSSLGPEEDKNKTKNKRGKTKTPIEYDKKKGKTFQKNNSLHHEVEFATKKKITTLKNSPSQKDNPLNSLKETKFNIWRKKSNSKHTIRKKNNDVSKSLIEQHYSKANGSDKVLKVKSSNKENDSLIKKLCSHLFSYSKSGRNLGNLINFGKDTTNLEVKAAPSNTKVRNKSGLKKSQNEKSVNKNNVDHSLTKEAQINAEESFKEKNYKCDGKKSNISNFDSKTVNKKCEMNQFTTGNVNNKEHSLDKNEVLYVTSMQEKNPNNKARNNSMSESKLKQNSQIMLTNIVDKNYIKKYNNKLNSTKPHGKEANVSNEIMKKEYDSNSTGIGKTNHAIPLKQASFTDVKTNILSQEENAKESVIKKSTEDISFNFMFPPRKLRSDKSVLENVNRVLQEKKYNKDLNKKTLQDTSVTLKKGGSVPNSRVSGEFDYSNYQSKAIKKESSILKSNMSSGKLFANQSKIMKKETLNPSMSKQANNSTAGKIDVSKKGKIAYESLYTTKYQPSNDNVKEKKVARSSLTHPELKMEKKESNKVTDKGLNKKNPADSRNTNLEKNNISLNASTFQTEVKSPQVCQKNTQTENVPTKNEVGTIKSSLVDPVVTDNLHLLSAEGKYLDEIGLEGDLSQYNIEKYKGFKIRNASSDAPSPSVMKTQTGSSIPLKPSNSESNYSKKSVDTGKNKRAERVETLYSKRTENNKPIIKNKIFGDAKNDNNIKKNSEFKNIEKKKLMTPNQLTLYQQDTLSKSVELMKDNSASVKTSHIHLPKLNTKDNKTKSTSSALTSDNKEINKTAVEKQRTKYLIGSKNFKIKRRQVVPITLKAPIKKSRKIKALKEKKISINSNVYKSINQLKTKSKDANETKSYVQQLSKTSSKLKLKKQLKQNKSTPTVKKLNTEHNKANQFTKEKISSKKKSKSLETLPALNKIPLVKTTRYRTSSLTMKSSQVKSSKSTSFYKTQNNTTSNHSLKHKTSLSTRNMELDRQVKNNKSISNYSNKKPSSQSIREDKLKKQQKNNVKVNANKLHVDKIPKKSKSILSIKKQKSEYMTRQNIVGYKKNMQHIIKDPNKKEMIIKKSSSPSSTLNFKKQQNQLNTGNELSHQYNKTFNSQLARNFDHLNQTKKSGNKVENLSNLSKIPTPQKPSIESSRPSGNMSTSLKSDKNISKEVWLGSSFDLNKTDLTKINLSEQNKSTKTGPFKSQLGEVPVKKVQKLETKSENKLSSIIINSIQEHSDRLRVLNKDHPIKQNISTNFENNKDRIRHNVILRDGKLTYNEIPVLSKKSNNEGTVNNVTTNNNTELENKTFLHPFKSTTNNQSQELSQVHYDNINILKLNERKETKLKNMHTIKNIPESNTVKNKSTETQISNSRNSIADKTSGIKSVEIVSNETGLKGSSDLNYKLSNNSKITNTTIELNDITKNIKPLTNKTQALKTEDNNLFLPTTRKCTETQKSKMKLGNDKIETESDKTGLIYQPKNYLKEYHMESVGKKDANLIKSSNFKNKSNANLDINERSHLQYNDKSIISTKTVHNTTSIEEKSVTPTNIKRENSATNKATYTEQVNKIIDSEETKSLNIKKRTKSSSKLKSKKTSKFNTKTLNVTGKQKRYKNKKSVNFGNKIRNSRRKILVISKNKDYNKFSTPPEPKGNVTSTPVTKSVNAGKNARNQPTNVEMKKMEPLQSTTLHKLPEKQNSKSSISTSEIIRNTNQINNDPRSTRETTLVSNKKSEYSSISKPTNKQDLKATPNVTKKNESTSGLKFQQNCNLNTKPSHETEKYKAYENKTAVEFDSKRRTSLSSKEVSKEKDNNKQISTASETKKGLTSSVNIPITLRNQQTNVDIKNEEKKPFNSVKLHDKLPEKLDSSNIISNTIRNQINYVSGSKNEITLVGNTNSEKLCTSKPINKQDQNVGTENDAKKHLTSTLVPTSVNLPKNVRNQKENIEMKKKEKEWTMGKEKNSVADKELMIGDKNYAITPERSLTPAETYATCNKLSIQKPNSKLESVTNNTVNKKMETQNFTKRTEPSNGIKSQQNNKALNETGKHKEYKNETVVKLDDKKRNSSSSKGISRQSNNNKHSTPSETKPRVASSTVTTSVNIPINLNQNTNIKIKKKELSMEKEKNSLADHKQLMMGDNKCPFETFEKKTVGSLTPSEKYAMNKKFSIQKPDSKIIKREKSETPNITKMTESSSRIKSQQISNSNSKQSNESRQQKEYKTENPVKFDGKKINTVSSNKESYNQKENNKHPTSPVTKLNLSSTSVDQKKNIKIKNNEKELKMREEKNSTADTQSMIRDNKSPAVTFENKRELNLTPSENYNPHGKSSTQKPDPKIEYGKFKSCHISGTPNDLSQSLNEDYINKNNTKPQNLKKISEENTQTKINTNAHKNSSFRKQIVEDSQTLVKTPEVKTEINAELFKHTEDNFSHIKPDQSSSSINKTTGVKMKPQNVTSSLPSQLLNKVKEAPKIIEPSLEKTENDGSAGIKKQGKINSNNQRIPVSPKTMTNTDKLISKKVITTPQQNVKLDSNSKSDSFSSLNQSQNNVKGNHTTNSQQPANVKIDKNIASMNVKCEMQGCKNSKSSLIKDKGFDVSPEIRRKLSSLSKKSLKIKSLQLKVAEMKAERLKETLKMNSVDTYETGNRHNITSMSNKMQNFKTTEKNGETEMLCKTNNFDVSIRSSKPKLDENNNVKLNLLKKDLPKNQIEKLSFDNIKTQSSRKVLEKNKDESKDVKMLSKLKEEDTIIASNKMQRKINTWSESQSHKIVDTKVTNLNPNVQCVTPKKATVDKKLKKIASKVSLGKPVELKDEGNIGCLETNQCNDYSQRKEGSNIPLKNHSNLYIADRSRNGDVKPNDKTDKIIVNPIKNQTKNDTPKPVLQKQTLRDKKTILVSKPITSAINVQSINTKNKEDNKSMDLASEKTQTTVPKRKVITLLSNDVVPSTLKEQNRNRNSGVNQHELLKNVNISKNKTITVKSNSPASK